MPILEAVPNISEGKNSDTIACIAQAAGNVPGVRVLHTDANLDANRTVITLAGEPQAVIAGTFNLLKTATQLIDMRTQHGAHPRLGAVDVCPLVPISGLSLSQAAAYANQLAQRAAHELNLPIYLYEENARTQARRNLAFIRHGEYETLPEKLHQLPPDYGPQVFDAHVARTGATVIGARKILIAFNMSLNTSEVSIAQKIAVRLREKNGGLQAVKAIGWYMAGYGCAQVSCNLTDFKQTGLAEVFETCKKLTAEHHAEIIASELIGLAPQEALIQAGEFYTPSEKNTTALIDTAAANLLLHKIRPFIPNERIIEYVLQRNK